MSTRGSFKPAVQAGKHVKKGQIIGWSNGKKIISPLDSIITLVGDAGSDFPANFPIFQFEYKGFALSIDANSLLRGSGEAKLTGKFQITDGPGPSECVTVMRAAGNAGNPINESLPQEEKPQSNPQKGIGKKEESQKAETSKENPLQNTPQLHAATSTLICLIDKALPIRPGQEGTLVVSALQRKNVLLAPVSAVAGRAGVGRVTKIDNSGRHEVEVKLGVTDGANIEIISGLTQGDKIEATAPNLDPRGK